MLEKNLLIPPMSGVLRAEEGNMLGVFRLSSAAAIGISLAASEAESLSDPEIYLRIIFVVAGITIKKEKKSHILF